MFEKKLHIGPCTLYLGDCFDIIGTLSGVTLVHTDPPYLIHSGRQNSDWWERIGMNRQQENLDAAGISDGFDTDRFFSLCSGALRSPNYQIWCSKRQFPELLNRAISSNWSWQDIMLYRNNAVPNLNGKYLDKDYLLHMWKGRKLTGGYADRQTGYRWSIGGRKEWDHPALKPIEPVIHMLKTGSCEGDVVLDPFMGSGTTGEACIRTGRRFIGIERDGKYFEMAVRRLEKAVSVPEGGLF